MKQLFINGLVWQKQGFTILDLVIEDGIIIKLGQNLYEPFIDVVDCQGAFILPAIADMHVHVGERASNLELADSFKSLSKLADSIGLAAIGAFITEHTSTDDKHKTLVRQYEQAVSKAKAEFKHDVFWHLTPTNSEPQDIIPLFKEGCDLKFYTTYKPYGIYKSYAEIERWMQDLQDFKPRMLVHSEDDELVTSMSESIHFQHPFDHTRRRTEAAEVKAVERLLDLAVKYNYPVHIVHVSAPKSALLIQQARKSAPVTCETAPHYLILNDSYLQRADGHRWLCTPPLRNEQSRGILVELLQDGLFDAIATDHCPYTIADKDANKSSLTDAPMGIAGLGATLPVLYEKLVKTGKLPLEKLMTMLSTNPAKLMQLHPKLGTIEIGSTAKLIILQKKPLPRPIPIIPSLSDTFNVWQDFTHTLNYTYIEA